VSARKTTKGSVPGPHTAASGDAFGNVQFWCRSEGVVGFSVRAHCAITLAQIEFVWPRVSNRETRQDPSCPGLNGLRQLSLGSRATLPSYPACSSRRS
jgi:hypothetical protein